MLFYLEHLKKGNVNNWDLVDSSAHKIVGKYLFEFGEDKQLLVDLTKGNLWEQRASMIATFYFIGKEDFDLSFEIADLLMKHNHDLIHKAVGWGIREIGKRNLLAEEWFLKDENRYKKMPRTMLRYAIEKFPKEKREKYLKGLI